MEYYGNTLCISHTELTAGIMTENYLKQLRHRSQIVQVRRGCYGTPALFAVDSLPLKYRVEVYHRHPDLQEKAESKPFMETIEPDGRAMQFYADYVLSDGRHLSDEKQREYANNCAIMNAFRRLLEESNSHRLRQSRPKVNKAEFWRKASAALPRFGDRWPNTLPESERRLQRKFNEYQREGYECFVSKKFQNANSAKVDDDVKESLLLSLIAHHNNLDNAKVSALYNSRARANGWKEITASTVGVWREKFDLVTAAGRLGASNFRNKRSMQVKRTRPTAPFLMWTLDGWVCELLYQSSKTDARGHTVTTYTNRLCLEVVLDPCCNYPIGYAVGTHETPELIKEALRNAALHSKELFGEMLRANQIQSDRNAIKKMSPLYAVMGDKVTPARAKNAKSKVVEPYFGYLNKTYCQLCNNWSGFGITTDPMRQPNSEALNQLRHEFPDMAGVKAQIDEMMRLERLRKVGLLREMMEQLPSDRRLPLSRESYLLHFGAETGFKNAIEGGGLRPTLLGVKRDYDCFDIGFREHASTRWTVKYDPDDLSEVLAVNEDGTLRYMLQEKYVQPMALADRRAGDAAHLQQTYDFNKRLEQHVTQKLCAAHQTLLDHKEVLIGSEPDNILTRLLLVNSDGQHKLERDRQRLKASDIDAIEVKTVETPIMPQGTSGSDKDDYSIF